MVMASTLQDSCGAIEEGPGKISPESAIHEIAREPDMIV